MASKVTQVPTSSTTSVQRDGAQEPWLRDIWQKGAEIYQNTPDMGATATNMFQASDAYNNAASSPLLGQARDYYTGVARGDYLRPDSNPYFQGMVDQTIQAARPSVDSAFASTGRLGSGAHAAAFSDAALRASTGLGYQNYQTERGYQDQANGMLPNIAAMPAGFLQQGAALRQQATALPQDTWWNALSNYKGAVGDPLVSGQSTLGMQPMQQANPLMQGLGALTGLAGMGLSAYRLSDERAKEDIQQVGLLNNGLPVYSYRYKGSPQTEIGLLAQEVAQVRPEAVGHMGGGLLGVDYEAATA